MREELARRASNTQQVLAYFRARPGQWIGIHALAQVGGFAAWRTRVADSRRTVKQAGGDIVWNGKIKDSAYMYTPYVSLGRAAETRVSQKELF